MPSIFSVVNKINADLRMMGTASPAPDISRNDPPKVIKKTYKKLMLLVHPDKQGGNKDLMIMLQKAYEEWLAHPDLIDIDDPDLIASAPQFAGLIQSPRVPHSQKFMIDHQGLVQQYRKKPLNSTMLNFHLRPFVSTLNDGSIQAEVEIKISDIFELIAYKTKKDPTGARINIPDNILSPDIAIKIFRDFLIGNYYGNKLSLLTVYLSSEINKITETHQGSSILALYQGILEIISIKKVEPEIGEKILLSLEKIITYAHDASTTAMPFLVPLFQGKQFRELFSLALHTYWNNSANLKPSNERPFFNGQEITKKYFQELKERLSQTKNDKPKLEKLKNTIRYVNLLHQLEKDLNSWENALFSSYKENPANYFRKKAYYCIDWMFALAGQSSREISINVLLQAGNYFQKASCCEKDSAVQMADEQLALKLYLLAASIAHRTTPDIELYFYIHSLKAILTFQFTDEKRPKIIQAFQHRALQLADIFPFYEELKPNINFFKQSERSLLLLRNFLHALIDIIEANKNKPQEEKITLEHNSTTVFYHVYESCLKNWYEDKYDPEQEQKFRLMLMEELLAEKKWRFLNLDKNIDFPWIMVDRTQEGWLKPINTLPLMEEEEKFTELNGIEINYKTGEINFIFKKWDDQRLQYKKLLTLYDLEEMLEKDLDSAIFSLDPVDPDMPYHPFNAMRFSPDSLYGSQLLQTMFLTDYLLKFLTMNQEIQGRFPYQGRPLKELLTPLPEHLRNVIENFRQDHTSESTHRFWIEAEEITASTSEDNIEEDGIQRLAIGDMRMVVKKHLMARTLEGNLVDSDEEDEGWKLYFLTYYQKQEVDQGIRIITGPAMIFIAGTETIYFLEEDGISTAFTVQNYSEILTRLSQQKRDSENKLLITSENSWLIYCATREITSQAGKSHHFTPEYIFAKEFTAHYNEFAQYFPEFGRLRELSRIAALIRLLNGSRKSNQEIIQKLQNKLNDWTFWRDDERKIESAITDLQKEYEKKYQKEYAELEKKLSVDVEKWTKLLDWSTLYDEAKIKLEKMKQEIDTEKKDKFNKIRAQFGSANIDFNYLQKEINKGLSKQLQDIFYPMLSKSCSIYEVEQHVNDFLSGNSFKLASAMAEQNKTAIKKQILSELEKSFSMLAPTINFKEVLEGSYNERRRLVQCITDYKFSDYKKQLEINIKQLNQIIPEKKQAIQRQLNGHCALEAQLQQIGAGKNVKPDLSQTCLWVPANIVHEEGEKQTHLVYGGVNIQSRIVLFGRNDFQRNAL